MGTRFFNPNSLTGCLAVFPLFFLGTAPVDASAVSTQHGETKTQRLSVIDYLNLLPSFGIGYSATPQEKYQLLHHDGYPIIDMRHDYLLIHPDASPAEQIAVFRAHGKPDLLAVSLPDSESDYNNFTLYRLRNGRLSDVTKQMLPMPPRTDHFLYEIPEFGTTIRVFKFDLETQSRHHAFDLRWRKGRFVKVHV